MKEGTADKVTEPGGSGEAVKLRTGERRKNEVERRRKKERERPLRGELRRGNLFKAIHEIASLPASPKGYAEASRSQ